MHHYCIIQAASTLLAALPTSLPSAPFLLCCAIPDTLQRISSLYRLMKIRYRRLTRLLVQMVTWTLLCSSVRWCSLGGCCGWESNCSTETPVVKQGVTIWWPCQQHRNWTGESFTSLTKSQDVSSWSQHRTSHGENMNPTFCLIPIHAPISPLAFKEQFLLHARVSPLNCSIAICSPLVQRLFVLNSCRVSTEPLSWKDYHYTTAIERRNIEILI